VSLPRLLESRERQYLLRRMKKGPALERQELATFMMRVLKEDMGIDTQGRIEKFYKEWNKLDHVDKNSTYIW
jgi:hypothetical protein